MNSLKSGFIGIASGEKIVVLEKHSGDDTGMLSFIKAEKDFHVIVCRTGHKKAKTYVRRVRAQRLTCSRKIKSNVKYTSRVEIGAQYVIVRFWRKHDRTEDS